MYLYILVYLYIKKEREKIFIDWLICCLQITWFQLIEFNDEMDSGALNQNSSNSSYVTLWDLKYFDWKLISLPNNTGDVTLTVEATNYISNLKDKKDLNGTIRFVVSFGFPTLKYQVPYYYMFYYCIFN